MTIKTVGLVLALFQLYHQIVCSFAAQSLNNMAIEECVRTGISTVVLGLFVH
jgi:hypothetical protein